MKKKKIRKSIMVLMILIVIGVGGYFVATKILFKKKEDAPVQVIQVTSSIERYGYTLEDRDTDLFKKNFEELKELLNQEEYDKEEYLTLMSKLLIIDLYTINNKLSRYDIGGLEYVYEGARASFKTVAENTIYKTVENNLDGTRNQELPEVEEIEITDISEYKFTMPDESTVEGYRVKASWSYVKSLGYDTAATLVFIPDGEKLGMVYFD